MGAFQGLMNGAFPAVMLCLLLCSGAGGASFSPETNINVWPKPRSVSWPNPEAVLLSPAKFRILAPFHKHLRAAAKRYRRLIVSERHAPVVPPFVNVSRSRPPLRALSISVLDLGAPLQHGVDESYTLRVPAGGTRANLAAGTPWGAMRGLETFSQMVWGSGRELRVAAGVEVWDAPLFPHRGVMLDTSRNFYGVEDLVRTIGAMGANKLNVFHWHITDSHSFPLVLPSEPDLAAKGSYGPEMVYTPADVKRVVEHGMSYGVRVIPEIDSPGHTGSWAEAYPEIVTCANKFWWPAGTDWADRFASEPGTGHLNPLNPKTYDVLRNVLSDVAAMFPDSFFHSGADEIIPGCWKSDPDIHAFLSDGGSLSDLLETFINHTHPFIVSRNRTAVYWEDVLLDDSVRVPPSSLPPETTVLQTWNNGPNNTKRIVESGYRVIVSSSDFYYLDCGHGDFVGNESRFDRQISDPPGEPFNYGNGSGGSWCGPFKTWQRVYDYDIAYGLSEAEAELVLGGEVALWSEQADATVLDPRIWPRASAMAEALWSGNRDGNGKKRYAAATDRLNEWRYRMVKRGIGAEPIQPLWCVMHPGMCNTVQ
ncbi:hypothetical protein H6P81_017402 [Aristolochia fimbriata]|uniref:Beta-hexosaminidase n=1 Tax=Aristolochia fimbriata TaxID=158543 RepID=A0AAV7DYG9_ARIFI|nr:hypothetical protein H6P81_017402 [Aristolochia fimbriata]